MYLEPSTKNDCSTVSTMILDLMNYHRKLNNAPKEFWTTMVESEEMFNIWIKVGTVFKIIEKDNIVGFLYVKKTGKTVAVLEDLYIKNTYRNLGYGKNAMTLLDERMRNQGTTSLLVEVVPRNHRAIDLYTEIGFDHLNLIQLRKKL